MISIIVVNLERTHKRLNWMGLEGNPYWTGSDSISMFERILAFWKLDLEGIVNNKERKSMTTVVFQ